MLKLEQRSVEAHYRVSDGSGYGFDIIASKDENGWGANLTLHSDGLISVTAAIEGLKTAARHFLREASEIDDPPGI